MALNNLTLEEVRELASCTASCIRKTEAEIVVLIHPMYSGNVAQGVNKELGSMSSRYCRVLGGIPMAFEKVRISSDGGVFHTNPFIHLRVQAMFYVFSPEVGSVLEGSVKRKSPNHLSCLVHKTFNVSVPKPHNTPAQSWEGTSVEEGNAVRLVLSDVNMSFDLPMITGRLDGRIAAAGKSIESTEEKPPNASVDSGISSDHDEDGEKKIKTGKKKDKKGDKKGKVKVVSKKKGVKDKVKAEKKKKKVKEGEESDKVKKEKKKKKKKDEKEKRKKDKKGKKETSEEKLARKEKKKKDKEKKASKKDKEKTESKSSTEGDQANGDSANSVKIEQNKGIQDEDYSTPTIKSEVSSPAKLGVPKEVVKKECTNSEYAKQTILDKQIKVEVCSDEALNTSNASVGGEMGDFDDEDFFGKKSPTKKIKEETKVKKRKLEESPVRSKKKRKMES